MSPGGRWRSGSSHMGKFLRVHERVDLEYVCIHVDGGLFVGYGGMDFCAGDSSNLLPRFFDCCHL